MIGWTVQVVRGAYLCCCGRRGYTRGRTSRAPGPCPTTSATFSSSRLTTTSRSALRQPLSTYPSRSCASFTGGYGAKLRNDRRIYPTYRPERRTAVNAQTRGKSQFCYVQCKVPLVCTSITEHHISHDTAFGKTCLRMYTLFIIIVIILQAFMISENVNFTFYKFPDKSLKTFKFFNIKFQILVVFRYQQVNHSEVVFEYSISSHHVLASVNCTRNV